MQTQAEARTWKVVQRRRTAARVVTSHKKSVRPDTIRLASGETAKPQTEVATLIVI